MDTRNKAALINEVLLDFRHLERTTGEAIRNIIVDVLRSNNLDLSYLRGQAYDGASAMSSPRVGAQAYVKAETNTHAHYIHCHSHVLNLAASSSILQDIRNIIGLINEVFLFFDNSPKRQLFFIDVLKVYIPNARYEKLSGLCKTRWVERHTCLETFLELYEIVVYCLGAIVNIAEYPELAQTVEWSWDAETTTKANGMFTLLQSFKTVVTFVILKNTLDYVKSLASKLQQRDMDIIDEVISNIHALRSNINETFDVWFKQAQTLADTIGSVEETPRRTKAQRFRANVPAENPQGYYKRSVLKPFIDELLQQLNDRFSMDNGHVIQCLFSIIPSLIVDNANIQGIAADLTRIFHHQSLSLVSCNSGSCIGNVRRM